MIRHTGLGAAASRIGDELWDKVPDLGKLEKPETRPAQDSDDFLLFDSKRDYLTQLDHYHEWQRR